MELVKIICVTKNEHDLIEDYILFYGKIFGFHNVIIIDNDSTHPVVLDVYRRYIPLGLTVKTEKHSFMYMHEFMTAYIKSLNGLCEFVMFFETDEFLFQPNDSVIEPEKIKAYIRAVPETASLILYRHVYASATDPEDPNYIDFKFSLPARQMTKFYDQQWRKVFVRVKHFERMILSNHNYKISQGETIVMNDLGILHFHETGTKRKLEKSLAVIRGLEYQIHATDTIERQVATCKFYNSRKVWANHKIIYYINYLMRRWAIDHFKYYIERLPTIKEVDDLVKSDNIEKILFDIVELADKYGTTGKPSNFAEKMKLKFDTEDSLKEENKILYHEVHPKAEKDITQVRDFLLANTTNTINSPDTMNTTNI